MYAAIKNNLYAAQKLIEHRADLYKSKDKNGVHINMPKKWDTKI